jgi:glycosyltransferase involved in cell wall biosynthesis
MRVLAVINSMENGGAESHVADLLTAFHRLKPAGWSMDLCTLFPGRDLAPQVEAASCRWHALESSPRWLPSLAPKLAGLIRSEGYDLVHGHLFPAFYHLAAAARLGKGPKYLYSEHSVTNRRREIPALRLPERAAYRSFDRVIAVGWQVKDSLMGWLPELETKVSVLPNAIEAPLGPLSPPASGEPLLAVANFFHYKGLDILFAALELLARHFALRPEIKIVGDGQERQSLHRQVESLGLKDQVKFLGRRSREEVFRLMEGAYALVLPSRWEGLPMSVLEAMARARPVVASRVGDLPRLIDHGRNGLLVEPGDAPALAAALARLISSPAEVKAMGAAARDQVMEHYAMQPYLASLTALYQSCFD